MIRSTIPLAIALVCAPLAAQEPAQDSIYSAAQIEVRPEALNGEELGAALYARYPAPLKAAGVSGEVTVSMVVGPDGVPRDLELVSSTDTLFNAPTLEVASLLRFSPARMGGRPVSVRITLPVPWQAGPVKDAPGPDSLGAYGLSEVHVPPRPTKDTYLRHVLRLDRPAPAVAGGERTMVQVRLLVNPDGTVSRARVTRSGNGALDAPTIAAIQALRFTPGRLAGRPVPVWVELPTYWRAGASGPDLSPAHMLRAVERPPQPLNVPALQRAMQRAYPRDLRQAGITGSVTVRFRVDREGRIGNPVVTSSTDRRFNEATLAVIHVLRFRPAEIGRKRVPVWVELPMRWVDNR